MSRRGLLAPLVLAALCAAPVLAAEDAAPGRRLTLLVTGDNRGEIAPCG